MRRHATQLSISIFAAAIIVAPATKAIASTQIGDAVVIAVSGDTTACGAIDFFAGSPVMSCDGTVLSRALAGGTGMSDFTPALLSGSAYPLSTVACGGDVVDSIEIGGFDDLLFGAHGWVRFTTADGAGIASTDPFSIVAGVGATGPAASISPREFVGSGEQLAILEEDSSFELNRLVTVAPFQDPNQVVEVLEVGDSVEGVPITGFVFNSLSMNPSGIGMVRAQRNGLDEALLQFDAATGAVTQKLAVGDQAPGLAPGTVITRFRTAASMDKGRYSIKVGIFDPQSGSDDGLYYFNESNQVIAYLQEESPIPGDPNAVFDNISTPYVSSTGAFFIDQHVLNDGTRWRALDMVDFNGEFHTIALTGMPAPGGGTYGELAPNSFALNRMGLLVYRAEVVDIGFTYFGLDTTNSQAQPYRIIGPEDSAVGPDGVFTIEGLGTIPLSSGQDGRPTGLSDTQVGFNASGGGRTAVVRVNAVEIVVPPTGTPSITATASVTATTTATATPTATESPTVSPTASETPTSTPTATTTPTPTNTRDDVPLFTPTNTSTPTPSNTHTLTHTPTNTPTAPSTDFGDAPDDIEIPGRPTPGYPTLLDNNGARHVIMETFFLGQRVDAEGDGQPNVNATGDDENGSPSDEDGVTLPASLVPGQIVEAVVVASLRGRLDAWIDFNADGDWQDPGEQLLDDEEQSFELSQGPNQIAFTVPIDAVAGLTFARFRFSLDGGLDFDGVAPEGEVEDYVVTIALLGDVNCDGVLTSADVAEMVRNILNNTRSGCMLDDVNGDGSLGIQDIEELIHRIFGF